MHIQGNEALQVWNGANAVALFHQCRGIEKELDSIEPTPGYAGSKIQLGQAKAELQRCEDRAQAETDRNIIFSNLIREGEEAMLEWKAEYALDTFHKAAQCASFELKYKVGSESVVRQANPHEQSLSRDCIAKAAAEVARQIEVRKKAVDAAARGSEEPQAEDRVPAPSSDVD